MAERGKSRNLGRFASILLMVSVSFVLTGRNPAGAEVVIDTPRTNLVDLEAENTPGTPRNAFVTPSGSVDTGDIVGIWGSVDGWSVDVATGRVVRSTLPGTSAGVRFSGAQDGGSGVVSGTVTNAGSIFGGAHGVHILGDAVVTNRAGGSIESSLTGVAIGSGTVNNSGIIRGQGFDGVYVYGGGLIDNSAEGTIQGNTNGIRMETGTGTVFNYGSITAAQRGISIEQSGSVSNHGTISGTTGVVFSGPGSDFLFNAGTIIGTGGTAVQMGPGDDSVTLSTGSAFTGILNGGAGTDALALTGDGSIGIDRMVNFEDLLKEDAGVWTLTGNGSSGANISVNGGTLVIDAGAVIGDPAAVNASGTLQVEGVLDNNVLVQTGGTLSGRGVIGGNVANSGTVSPGGETRGTLTIDGDYLHNAGAVYRLDADFAGGTDRLDVGGTATLDGGTVQVVLRPGVFRPNVQSLILSAGGGVAGTFEQVLGGIGLVMPELTYDPNNVFLQFVQAVDFEDVALTPNQRAVARHLDAVNDRLAGDLADVVNELVLLTNPEIRSALDQMGGASHTAFTAVDIMKTSRIFRTLFRRPAGLPSSLMGGLTLDEPFRVAESGAQATDARRPLIAGSKPRCGLWVKGYGTFGDRDGTDIASRYDYTMGGVLAGMDMFFTDALRAGVAVGYSRTDLDLQDLRDSGNQDSYQAILYGSLGKGPWYVDAAFSYAYNDYEMSRNLRFGTINRTAESDYNGHEFAGYLEGGYRFLLQGFEVTPLGSLFLDSLHRDAFTERGAGGLNLRTKSESTTSIQTSLGGRLARDVPVREDLVVTPELTARWVHEFGDREALLNARFAGSPTGSFTVRSDKADRDAAVLTVGLTASACSRVSGFVYYDAELRGDQTDQAVIAGVRYSW